MHQWRSWVEALFKSAPVRSADRTLLLGVAIVLLAGALVLVYEQPIDSSPLVVFPLTLFAVATTLPWGIAAALGMAVAVAFAQRAGHTGGSNPNVAADVFFHILAYCSVVVVVAYIQLRRSESEKTARINERLYQREREISRILQLAALPLAFPAVPTFELDALYLPATRGLEIGGDWYDAFLLDERRMMLSIGDVAGHDLRSATMMARLEPAIRTLAYEGLMPHQILGRLNALLLRERDAYATALIALISLEDGRVTYACGGHPHPMICGHGEVRSLTGAGLMLGIDEESYEPYAAELAPGETLVLYSDGLIEAKQDLAQGESALREVLSGLNGRPFTARSIADRIIPQTPRRDDITLFIARRKEAGSR